MTSSDVIRIDCQGLKLPQTTIEVSVADLKFQFVLSDSRRRKTAFHAGLFFNQAAYNESVFRYPIDQRFCALVESPINPCFETVEVLKKRFTTIYTHQSDLLASDTVFKPLYFGTNWIRVRNDEDAFANLQHHPKKTKLASFIGSIEHHDVGAYQFRRQIAEECIRNQAIDCFGKGIHPITSKDEALRDYRFSVAMENTASDLYFSEKLIDCFLSETVPIYFGCPSIDLLFDPRGMLRFDNKKTFQQCLTHLSPTTYESMRPYLLANKQKAIARDWHSHRGLLRRVAAALPECVVSARPVVTKVSSMRRLSRKIKSLLHRQTVH
ncbi:glycosyltransferase family 10 [Roseiconus lacunae]|uniref:Glycosyltransferase family 10 n=1 Tax=Roseiconus lacunae TaxID=2605694 RepID=A0ABT7PPN3_9BACT|nr:glycosyltransferase family 10 [Roseiconus lacunae]MDM4018464.1 glycosyltransferase family 10 [Roseiconus lacunae]WRQ49114.1 glycosyltransferase family 10 [Stieleria sp. HD01]